MFNVSLTKKSQGKKSAQSEKNTKKQTDSTEQKKVIFFPFEEENEVYILGYN